MKDLVAGLALLMVLIIIFSAAGVPKELPGWGLFGDDYPGDRGMILPGGGNEMPDAVMQMDVQTTAEQNSGDLIRAGQVTVPGQTGTDFGVNEAIKKEENSMGEMVLVFWHGVAAVLIGETAALIVATVCMKLWIKRQVTKAEN